MKLSTNTRLPFAVCAVVLLNTCSGKLIVDEAFIEQATCNGIQCPTGYICAKGTCVEIEEPCVGDCRPCNLSHPDGTCGAGATCVNGSCHATGTGPEACGSGINGWCPGALACIDGSCVEIEPGDGCSPDRVRGVCPGGQVCVGGICFTDDNIDCSPSNPDGRCLPGQICTGERCLPDTPTCSTVLPEGSCSSWEICVLGECVGPAPNDRCEPSSYPNGRCPADEVCVGGTCALIADNACSDTNPNGLCVVGAGCDEGTCVAITEHNVCTNSNPGGLCEGGAKCDGGDCVWTDCGDGGNLCAPSFMCTSEGTCVPMPCDPMHPEGMCTSATLVCFQGLCLPPFCSLDFPDGTCLGDQVCDGAAGACRQPTCEENPAFGECPPGDICVTDGTGAGHCEEGPCQTSNLNGTCDTQVPFCVPTTGCNHLLDTVCCDDELAAQSGCTAGTCVGPPCSVGRPTGLCPYNEYCDNGECQPAPCDAFFPDGLCEDAAESCFFNGCRRIGCAAAPDPDAFCAPEICDSFTDSCVLSGCAPANPNGFCTPGTTCCNSVHESDWGCELGTCFVPGCSLTFPGGPCPAGQLCAGGACINAPCSPTYPQGSCSQSYECTGGVCRLASCSSTAPQGHCPSPTDRCVDGDCRPFVCSPEFPNGPCPVGQLCEDETCVIPGCSATFPGGACPGGQVCASGQCVDRPCSPSYWGGQCAAGFFCNQGICDPTPCGPAAPNGPCSGVGEVCKTGLCVPYVCGANFPDGPCAAAGELCLLEGSAPVCKRPPCSATYIGGDCPGPQVCVAGTCITPACSLSEPNGACPGGRTCCDDASASERGCVVGTCVLTACVDYPNNGYCPSGQVCSGTTCHVDECGSLFPNGPCPNPGEVCTSPPDPPTCQLPDCSPAAPGGFCPGSQVCVQGSCLTPGCSAAVPDGSCPASQVCCDGNLVFNPACAVGTCVTDSCANIVNGYCPAGERCLDNHCEIYECSIDFPDGPCTLATDVCIGNTCVAAPCDDTYIGGVCPGSEVCVNGTCIQPACSNTVTDGACPPNQVCCDETLVADRSCVLGTCVIGDCSVANPYGRCGTNEVCCQPDLSPAFCPTVGTCVTTACSAAFPFGSCGAGEICVSGTCELPCGDAQRVGWCPAGFACVEGACSTTCTDDADCDGISDIDEGLLALVNTDSAAPGGDASPDGLDRDSDADLIPDGVEAGDRDIGTLPADADGDGNGDWREVDADADFLSDTYEAGPAPSVPRDTDGDGTPDYADDDSDGDGITDSCEAHDLAGLCGVAGLVDAADVVDTDDDGTPDYRDLDSDNDGVPDCVESLPIPTLNDSNDNGVPDCTEGVPNGAAVQDGMVDHDGDNTPDYRDLDSDDDTVDDVDEDLNGDGQVNCQVDGAGARVADDRPNPACGSTSPPFSAAAPYDFNPGCNAAFAQKCVLAESSRIHTDTDGDGIADNADGVFLVCSAANLKKVNLFYSQPADYALALEQSYDVTHVLDRTGIETGLTFDDSVDATGSWATSGFVLKKLPAAVALGVSRTEVEREKLDKALAQEAADRELLAAAVDSLSLVINRNFISFDGYGVVISRYRITTAASFNTTSLRDILAEALDTTVSGFAGSGGPVALDFTFVTETLYRYDVVGGVPSPESVVIVGALVPHGANVDDPQTYSYRTHCANESVATCAGRQGCIVVGPACEEDPNFQIPLFFSDNITNGSALTQYGDDIDSLCQSLIQESGKLDFLWVVDASGSMSDERATVVSSAQTFFGILENTEADYRVGQTLAHATGESDALCNQSDNTPWPPNSDFGPCPTAGDNWGAAGCLVDDFTGDAVFGDPEDRDFIWNCVTGTPVGPGCAGTYDCAACEPADTLIVAPECHFAARLTCGNFSVSSGANAEMPLLMGMWALYRAGLSHDCRGVDFDSCEERAECLWDGAVCQPNNCDFATNRDDCETHPGASGVAGINLIGCLWDANTSTCVPNFTCDAVGADLSCYDGIYLDQPLAVDIRCRAATEAACVADCEWDEPGNPNSFCRPPLKRMMRPDAHPVLVLMTDEEDCFLMDQHVDAYPTRDNDCCFQKAYSGTTWNSFRELGDGSRTARAVYAYDDPVRTARQQGYINYYRSHGVTVFGLFGDKANQIGSACVDVGCGGCNNYGNKAQPGNAHIAVAEGTNGGWGSICAADIYPSIESIIIASLGIASPYHLEGFIDNSAVQPIASTIKVTVEVCDLPGEYPLCGSGTHMLTEVPRSRDSGYDYDSINNTLILYGGARPALGGDLAVSYRYWVDLPQPPEGDPSCPCPGTVAAACNCPPGRSCGTADGTDHCADQIDSDACGAVPGCRWNTADSGKCFTTGLCEPDSSCGAACALGTVCDPSLGLCVCDISCGGICSLGETCDHNSNVNPCHGVVKEAACEAIVGCSWDPAIGGCFSNTCGECLCDVACGGGCPVGQLCDSDTGSTTCGLCACDTSCGTDDCSAFDGNQLGCEGEQPDCFWDDTDSRCVGCASGLTCNDDIGSPLCGSCRPPQCGACLAGFVCDPATGGCVCDTSCGGWCPDGTFCQSDGGQPDCGRCLCETDCGFVRTGQTCPAGTICDSEVSATCGLCIANLDCSAGCNAACAAADQATCALLGSDCRWAPWMGAAGECWPTVCKNCDLPTGLCLADPACCGACGADNGGNPTDICNPNTGQCRCDTTCGGTCPAGTYCDGDPDHVATCGQCLCQLDCGAAAGNPCPLGTACDGESLSPTCGLCLADMSCGGGCNADCTAVDSTACGLLGSDCRWIPWGGGAGECVPVFCSVCDLGLCVADSQCCGSCGPGEICDETTGQCECDPTCGGNCPAGTICDGDVSSTTCGQCICETDCGEARTGEPCPTGALCSNQPGTCGLCLADPECGVGGQCNADCSSHPDEGSCTPDTECRWAPWLAGGPGCVPQVCTECNPSVGLCLADPNCCDACSPTETCNAFTGQCECDTDCSFQCGPGRSCDGDPLSLTCGECHCDPTCGGGCPPGNFCDSDPESDFCGLCFIDPTCGGDCPVGHVCNPSTGLCEVECQPCPFGQRCDPLTGECVCDQTCGGPTACALGTQCDSDSASSTCGRCICDQTCGGPCPAGQLCDDGDRCEGLDAAAGGECEGTPSCVVETGFGICSSPSCGLCLVDPTCGGGCPEGFECQPLTGLCVPKLDCSCPPWLVCDPLTLQCVQEGG